jgi:hypothetical protein
MSLYTEYYMSKSVSHAVSTREPCTGPDPASLTSSRLKKEDTVLWLKSLLNSQMNR